MPDTCLDTTKSQSPDVRLMRVANALQASVHKTHGGMVFLSITAIKWDEIHAVIRDVASDLRATIGRPSEQAANVIQVLQATVTRGDVDTAWLDLAATVRQLPPCEQSRVIVEARIAEAKAAKKGRFW
jgi:hypothetical protein